MTTRVITLWRVHVTSLTTSVSTKGFLTEIMFTLTLSVPDVISGRGDVGLITLVDVYFTKITLRVSRNVTCVSAQILWADRKIEIKTNN